MQHKHKLSDYREETEGGTFIYGFDSHTEEEDEPISIQTGLSLPAWKTPSIIQECSSEAKTNHSAIPSKIDSLSTDTESIIADFSEFEESEKADYTYSSADARAAIISEKPVRISLWKRFTSLVSRFIPSFADESFLSRLNYYLGGVAFVIVLIIFVIVLIIHPH